MSLERCPACGHWSLWLPDCPSCLGKVTPYISRQDRARPKPEPTPKPRRPRTRRSAWYTAMGKKWTADSLARMLHVSVRTIRNYVRSRGTFNLEEFQSNYRERRRQRSTPKPLRRRRTCSR